MSDIQLTPNAQEILDKVGQLTLMEIADLIKAMEEKFGVSAAVTMVAGGAGAGAGAAEETAKSEYTLELSNAGANKIAVIKVVKDITGLGLKEAKDLVDAAPKVIKENVPKADAEKFKEMIEQAGGGVNLK
ncbi:MAG TPA: 50S ribosomal protein L7/L12 [bacterium]|nr:50S ribosomal protein L7/L12 [bacterium]